MATINLLPHRIARRKQREREFYLHLGFSFAAAVGLLLLWGLWMGQRIDNQNDRNTILQNEIKQVDVRIATIKDLEKVRNHLLARKQVIEELQADRAKMVHLFDELVRTTPSNVRLKGLKQSGNSMSLDGVAQSNASVAQYMRNIETSPWMGRTDLRKTEKGATTDVSAGRMPYTFGLDVTLSSPKKDLALADGSGPDSATVTPKQAGVVSGTEPVAKPATASSTAKVSAAVSPVGVTSGLPQSPAVASSAVKSLVPASTSTPGGAKP